jgi:hypothetical protein
MSTRHRVVLLLGSAAALGIVVFACSPASPHSLKPSQWTSSTDQENNQLVVGDHAFWVENAGRPWSFNNAGRDNSTLRFEVHHGDRWSSSGWTDPPTSERTEIASTARYPLGTDIHVSYDFMVEPGPPNTAKWVVMGQFHQDPGSTSPPFEIDLQGEKMAIVIATGSDYRTLWKDRSNLERGRTYRMDIDATFDLHDGRLVVRRDGRELVNYRGPFGVWGMRSVYWKQGIYRSAAFTPLAANYGNLSITTGGK